MSKHKKILFFGNIPTKRSSNSIGGATILAQEMLRFLKDNQTDITHYDIRKIWIPKVHLLEHLFWIIRFPFILFKKDVVSFHTTWDFNFSVGPMLWLWSKVMNKRIIYHFFGGDFHTHFQALPSFIQKIYLNTILKSDVIFFETHQCIDFFKNLGVKNIQWLPNAREKQSDVLDDKVYTKKFVFISRVIREKGVEEIIKAAKQLDTSYTFDVYGPIDHRYFDPKEFENSNVNYKGELQPHEVAHVLKKYDFLLLPTYFSGEGYPGIIIEALAYGIPTITTQWISIPEIIQHNFNGFLIQPKDALALKNTILNINDVIFQKIRKNAFESFNNFDKKIVFRKLIQAYQND